MAAADPRDLESGSFKCSDYLCPRTAGIAAGKARIEGKDYVMRDGDVVEFRFNV